MSTKSRRRPRATEGSPEKKTKVAEAPKTVATVNIQRKLLNDLRPHPKNPRKLPDRGTAEYETMKASLEHDYFDPMVWNQRNGMLVSGHLRRRVLMDMGYHEADVVVVDYDEPTHIARLFAANKGLGKDDKASKKSLLQELLDDSAKLMTLTGYTAKEWEKFLESKGAGLEEQPDYPIAPMLGEKHDYVVVYTSNETDRAFLHSLLDIRQERSYKSTSIGIGRVVTFKRFMESLVKNKVSISEQAASKASEDEEQE